MAAISPPVFEIAACAQAHQRLFATIDDLSDEQVRQASGLPGWTRAHVLAHLTGNADGVVRRLSAAAEGQLVDQYIGGFEGRAAEIELRSQQSAAFLIGEVHRSADDVEAVFASYPDDAWDRPIKAVNGPDRPAQQMVFSRWHEIEAHHVDLDLSDRVEDWPPTLVEQWLPGTVEGLTSRADSKELLGWLLGRSAAPTLKSWG